MTEERDRAVIYTIGHGNRSLQKFLGLLEQAGIGCLIDVRAFPGSRRHPQFGRGELEHTLPAMGIKYVCCCPCRSAPAAP